MVRDASMGVAFAWQPLDVGLLLQQLLWCVALLHFQHGYKNRR